LCQIEGQPNRKKMKISTKRFVISSSKVNTKGFAVDPLGIDLSEYEKNPLMLWMHQRPKGKSKDEVLPIGNWVDLKIENGKLTGVPAFDESDSFAMQLFHKVENGTLRMASAGLKPKLWQVINGVKTLVKSIASEISLVDIGSDPDALAVVLYNESDELIHLSDDFFSSLNLDTKPKSIKMELIQLKASEILPLVKLGEGATEEEAVAKVTEILTLAETQAAEIVTLKAEKEAVEVKLSEKETELETLEKETKQKEIITLVDTAVAERRITADQKPHFVKLAAVDFDGTKAVIESMPANPTVKSQMINLKEDEKTELIKLGWDNLDKSGKLPELKKNDPETFNLLYKNKFGKDYKKD
jgi:hypothetical protein